MKRTVNRVLGRLMGRAAPQTPAAVRKSPATAKKLVWRISSSTPGGEWVDPAAAPAPRSRPDAPETTPGGWTTSSMDLLGGAEIVEYPDDTAPASLYDEVLRGGSPGEKQP